MAEKITCKVKLMNTSEIKMTCPFKGYSSHTHKGVDLIPKSTAETPTVYSISAGTVIATGNVYGTNESIKTIGCGTYVAVQDNEGNMVRYQHLKYGSLKVKKGDTVKVGQAIAVYGRPTTGNSSGPHLHLDISFTSKPSESYLTGKFCNKMRYYVNPLPYLSGEKTIGKATSKKTSTYTKRTTAPLNVRSGPSVNYKRLRTLPVGTKVTIYSTSNGFARISADADEWCSLAYLR